VGTTKTFLPFGDADGIIEIISNKKGNLENRILNV
jgi:hypothetical protein